MSEKVFTPIEMLEKWVKKDPQKIFLKQPINREILSFSWQETWDEARKVADYLSKQNFPKGSHIALMSKNCAHWIICDLGIWMAGHVSIPLYPNLNPETIRQILDHSESKLLFVGKLDGWNNMKSGVPEKTPMISFPHKLYKTDSSLKDWDQVIKEPIVENKIYRPSLEEIATIIYTSGTTGLPKGVVHSFGSYATAISHAVKELNLLPSERIFSYLPLSHVAERLLAEAWALYCGGTIFFAENLDTFKDDLLIAKPTIFLAVPRIWSKFQEGILKKLPQAKLNLLLNIPLVNLLIKKKIRAGLGLSDARNACSGAAAIPKTLIEWYKKLGINIQEAYGMTENFAYSHFNRHDCIEVGSVGQTFPLVDCKISDQGEILVKSPGSMLGYYKMPKESQEMFDGGYLKTGDQGEITSKGFLKITGRVKDLFKTSKGKYVAPSPIELKISSSPILENVCLVGSGLPQPIAICVLSEIGKQMSKNEVESELQKILKETNGTLDDHERVKKIFLVKEAWTVENNFLTPSMKIKRNMVEKKYLSVVENLKSPSAIVWE